MASTDYDFILTRNELIEESYRKVGVLEDGENITSSQLETANKKLNLILKKWSEDGVKLWTQIVEAAVTVDGQNYISLPNSNGMAYVDLIMVEDGDVEIEIDRWTKREYQQCHDKESEGKPLQFYQDMTDSRIYLWPVPDAVYNLKLYGVKTLKDWEVESDTGELKARWQIAIKYALATEIAEDYRMDLKFVRDLREVAGMEYRLAMNKETEVSKTRRMKGVFER